MPPLTGTSDNDVAAASTGSITSGTASEAMIKAASAASSADTLPAGEAKAGETTPSGGSGAPVAISDATGQPVVEGSAAKPAAIAGEAPEARITAAVRNAREEVETKYAWAKDLNPRDVGAAIEILNDLRRDPANFLTRLTAELDARGGAPKTKEEPKAPKAFPAGKLRAEDGTLAYSADQIPEIVSIIKEQIREELMGELNPDRQFIGELRGHLSESQMREQSRQTVAQVLAEARKLPHFTKENEPAIMEELKAIPDAVKAQYGVPAALYMAYTTFLNKKVFPTINTAAEAKVREDNAKKAAASVGAHPVAGVGGDKTPKLNGVDDLARHMERMAAAATA